MNLNVKKYFRSLATHNLINLWQLFIDNDRQHNIGPLGFDIKEPGYLKSMMNGFDYIIQTINTPIDRQYIQTLHDLSIASTTTYLQYIDEQENVQQLPQAFEQGYRLYDTASFALDHKNATAIGLAELYNQIHTAQLPGVHLEYMLSNSANETLHIENYTGIVSDYIPYFEKIIAQTTSGTHYLGVFTEAQHMLERTQAHITEFNSTINRAQTTEEKLHIICRFIQKIEVTHPFSDANCRTFGVLLLNKLLLQYDLSPCILKNPNIIDAYSLKELIEEITIGMEKFSHLHQLPAWRPTAHTPPETPQPTTLLYLYGNNHLTELFVRGCLTQSEKWQQLPEDEKQRTILQLVAQITTQQQNGYTEFDIKRLSWMIKTTVNAATYNPLQQHIQQTAHSYFPNHFVNPAPQYHINTTRLAL